VYLQGRADDLSGDFVFVHSVLGGLTFASSAFKIFNRKGRKDEKAADARP
jgi:hypothetical protein